MKRLPPTLILWAACAAASFAEVEVTESPAAQVVFSGRPAEITLLASNMDAEPVEVQLNVRVMQLASRVAMPVGEAHPWKALRILGGQTVVEKITVSLPEVRVPSLFQLAFSTTDGAKVGSIPVTACPPKLASQIRELAGGAPVGIWDTEDALIPLLESAEVPFERIDLVAAQPASARPILFLLPSKDLAESRQRLEQHLQEVVKAGAAAVVIEPSQKLRPDQPMLIEKFRAGAVCRVSLDPSLLRTSAAAQLLLIKAMRITLEAARREPSAQFPP